MVNGPKHPEIESPTEPQEPVHQRNRMILIDGYLVHSTRRAWDRYGLRLNEAAYAALSLRLTEKGDGCVLLSNVCLGRQKWAIWYKGEWMAVIFDPAQGRIVTVLPKDMLRRFADLLPW